MKTTIIAEIGVNHNGSIKKALALILQAKKAGADVAKFQLFQASSLVTKNAPKAKYQKTYKNDNQKQFDLIKKLELSYKDFFKIKNFCKTKKIEFMVSVFDEYSLNFLKKLKLKIIKIPSGEITNYPLLQKIGKLKKEIILSTGMSNYIEISEAIKILVTNGTKKNKITVLQCNTSYPTPLADVNLSIMNEIKKKFKVKIGFSDHTNGIEIPIAAVALGAKVIEKHFTLNKNDAGPDHRASLEPQKFEEMVHLIKNVELALGNKIKKITKSEISNLLVCRKSIVAKRKIQKGEKFSENNLTTKRPAKGMSPMKWKNIIGKKSKKIFKKDDYIKI